MKKIITLLASALFVFSSTFGVAQTDKKATSKKSDAKKETAAPATTTTTTDGPKLKKDGTPDKRYKENKEAAKPAGPTKKDGTPDKRYKENKKK